MNMNKTIKQTLFAAVALLGAGVTLEAAPINGSITIRGGAHLNTTNVNTAARVTSWLNAANMPPTVVSRSGDFAIFVSRSLRDDGRALDLWFRPG